MEVGNRIRFNGKELTVRGRAAAGKHVQWTLSDGNQYVDLHLNDEVEVIDGFTAEQYTPDIKRKKFIGEEVSVEEVEDHLNMRLIDEDTDGIGEDLLD
jgi:hypothetical protein